MKKNIRQKKKKEENFNKFNKKKKKTNYTQKKAGIKKMSDEKIYKTHKKQRGQ